jgi:hypothetical protein
MVDIFPKNTYMSTIFVTLIVVTTVVIVVLLRKRQQREMPATVQSPKSKPHPLAQSETTTKSAGADYRAASLHVEKTSCAAAKGLAGKRFLGAETPAIPLKECDRIGDCPCKFRKHIDRRSDDDRRSNSYAVDRINASEEEQLTLRAKTDRRQVGEDDMDIFDFK